MPFSCRNLIGPLATPTRPHCSDPWDKCVAMSITASALHRNLNACFTDSKQTLNLDDAALVKSGRQQRSRRTEAFLVIRNSREQSPARWVSSRTRRCTCCSRPCSTSPSSAEHASDDAAPPPNCAKDWTRSCRGRPHHRRGDPHRFGALCARIIAAWASSRGQSTTSVPASGA